jgi:hypothetical protein
MSFITVLPETDEMTMDVGVLNTDTATFTPTSVEQVYKVDRQCVQEGRGIFVTWLNSLGCWEYFLFYGRIIEGVSFDLVQRARRNILENWDINFTSGETDYFFANVEGFEGATVFSQMLDKEMAKSIWNLVPGIQAQKFLGFEDQKITILIDKNPFTNSDTENDLGQVFFSYIETSPLPIQNN